LIHFKFRIKTNTMKTFHDVLIYSGTKLVTTGSRFEIAAKNPFLGEMLSNQHNCNGCKEPTVLIFPEENVTILKEAFEELSHFKSSFSIIQNPQRVKLLLSSLGPPGLVSNPNTGVEDQGAILEVEISSGDLSDSGHTTEQQRLSQALERVMDLSYGATQGQSQVLRASGDAKLKHESSSKDLCSKMITKKTSKDGNENVFTSKKEKKDLEVASVDQENKVTDVKNKHFKYRCKLCKDRWYPDKKRLYRHYSHAHFRKELQKLIGNRRERCPYCDQRFQDHLDVVGHVGCFHKKVEDFLPKHFHVKTDISNKISPQPQPHPPAAQLEKNTIEFTCGLCENIKTFNRRSDLYEHYSCCHYRTELSSFINKESDKCLYCPLIHKTPTDYKKIRHIGVVHKMVERLLPKSLHIPKACAHLETVSEVVKRSSTEAKTGSNSNELHCHLCHFKHLRRSKLYSHYSSSHYRRELLSLIDVHKLNCTQCGERKADVDSLLKHIGSTHRVVEQFLPGNRNKNFQTSSDAGKETTQHLKGMLSKNVSEVRRNELAKNKTLAKTEAPKDGNPLKDSEEEEEEKLQISYHLQRKIHDIRSIFGDLSD